MAIRRLSSTLHSNMALQVLSRLRTMAMVVPRRLSNTSKVHHKDSMASLRQATTIDRRQDHPNSKDMADP